MHKSSDQNEIRVSLEDTQEIWRDRRRYFHALRTLFKIESSYRRLNEQITDWQEEDKVPLMQKLHQRNAILFSNLCKTNGVSWVKFAQFLSARPDLLPREYIQQLQKLQNDCQSLPFLHLEVVLVENWGPNWEHYFDWIEQKPRAKTPIAQLHKAKLVDGPEVAIKILLPGVKQQFTQDILLFKTLARVLSSRVPQLDLIQITDDVLRMTEAELDFKQERVNLQKFSQLPHIDHINTARLVEAWCTEQVLVTEWIHAVRLTDFLAQAKPEEARYYLALLQDSYLQQITQFGVFQADAHCENFLVGQQDCELYILNCSALAELNATEKYHYGNLLLALLGQSTDDLDKLLRRAGFEGVDRDLIQELSTHIHELTQSKQPHLPQAFLQHLLDRMRDHRVEVPDSFIAVARVLMTLSGLLQDHDVPFSWTTLWRDTA